SRPLLASFTQENKMWLTMSSSAHSWQTGAVRRGTVNGEQQPSSLCTASHIFLDETCLFVEEMKLCQGDFLAFRLSCPPHFMVALYYS
ncbi:hypothetical protein V5799_008880, partial [Amblyomma americanum]